MTYHEEFEDAGTEEGLAVWRIENFNPVPVPEKKVGKFYAGDSYIILKGPEQQMVDPPNLSWSYEFDPFLSQKPLIVFRIVQIAKKHSEEKAPSTRGVGTRVLGWDLHYWLGKETSQDEAGAAALHAVGLDTRLGGGAVHHREVQHHESALFLSYFKPAIRYLQGGHESGFNEVEINAGAEKRMFQIRGTTNIRARQVEPSISSMNQTDCFILNLEHDIFVYVGTSARSSIKLKAIALANQIRDEDHNGRARIQVVDEYSDDEETAEFFMALGSGSRELIPEESDNEDDEVSEASEDQTISLYEVSDHSGELEIHELPGPYSQDQLSSTECYILDSVNCGLYVWIGKECSQEARSGAMVQAEQYRESKNYPSWVQLTRVPQGTEPTAFKQYFTTWGEIGASAGYDNFRFLRTTSDEDFYSEDLEVSAQCAKKIGKTGSARGFMPDEGDGDVTVYRIDEEYPVELYSGSGSDETDGAELGARFGQFYQGHAYVVRYDHGNGHVVYCWLGKDATEEDKLAASTYADTLNDELEGITTQISVPQGQEPKHFLNIFKGHMVIFLGGKASEFQKCNQKCNYDEDGTRLFKIHGTIAGVDMRAEQVPEYANNLLDDDVFLLERNGKVYVWNGKECTEEEKQGSLDFATVIFGSDVELECLDQGEETDDFWEALGGHVEGKALVEWRKAVNTRIGLQPKLLEVSIRTKRGVTKVYLDEIHDYKQEDLSPDNVYVFDTWEEIYVWLGNDAEHDERKAVKSIIEKHLSRDTLWRSPSTAVVVKVKQGREPDMFKRMFGEWDNDLWTNKLSYIDIKASLNQQQEV